MCVAITTILVLVYIICSDNPRWAWLGTVSLAILITCGVAGGIAGLWLYGIRGKQVPRSIILGRGSSPLHAASSITWATNTRVRRVFAVILLLVSCVLFGYFSIAIVLALKAGKGASTNLPVSVDKPGSYTLFVPKDVLNATNHFEMRLAGRDEVLKAAPVFGSEEFRDNGERYEAVGHFDITTPGNYYVKSDGNQAIERMLLKPRLSGWFFMSVFGSFTLGSYLLASAARLCRVRR